MKRILVALTILLGSADVARAQTTAGPASPAPPAPAGAVQAAGADSGSIYDKVWRQFTLYDDKTNRVVQRVQLSGRFQHEFVSVDADEGKLDEWNTRRFRVGPRLQLAVLHGIEALEVIVLEWVPAAGMVSLGLQVLYHPYRDTIDRANLRA